MANRRIRHLDLLKGLYAHAQHLVAQQASEYVMMALDPVNFEKPYCQKVEGVSTVMKSTPPALDGKKRLTRGYPAMTATIVDLAEPAITYASMCCWLALARSLLLPLLSSLPLNICSPLPNSVLGNHQLLSLAGKHQIATLDRLPHLANINKLNPPKIRAAKS